MNFIGISQVIPINNEVIYKKAYYKIKESYNFKIGLDTYNFYKTFKNKDSSKFDYYFSPDKLFVIIKIIIAYNIKMYKSKKTFIYINMWNEFYNPTILGPNKKYGFGFLNSLSKALFNLSYAFNYNLTNLEKSTKIAIQAHVFYEILTKQFIQLLFG